MALSTDVQLELVGRARHGSPSERERAMAELLADFRPPALAVVNRTLAAAGYGSEHADEALQQAMFKFQRAGLDRFEGRAAPRTYFVRMALNCAVDVIRRMSRHVARTEGSVENAEHLLAGGSVEDLALAFEDAAEQANVRQTLSACVDELSSGYREPVVMYYLEQQGSCEQCAEVLGIAKLAFMQRLSRARKKLAACIKHKLQRSSLSDRVP